MLAIVPQINGKINILGSKLAALYFLQKYSILATGTVSNFYFATRFQPKSERSGI